MKKLPVGIQTFEKIITNNYLYVDKTDYVYKMIEEGEAYFLSRPRRFGKSLFVSTLKAFFNNNKNLFSGLNLAKVNSKWEKYPIIHIDFSEMPISKPEDVDIFLKSIISAYISQYDLSIQSDQPVELLFKNLLVQLSRIHKVVLLIDEYDKPILDTLGQTSVCIKIKEKLKSFYTIIKACDEYLRFVFLTGVSKFSKISVFSGLNNLRDITMEREFAGICGYTQEELEKYFKEYFHTLAQEMGISQNELKEKIKFWYNGFRFSEKRMYLYNPLSVLRFFQTHQFKEYWFETATPTFLITMLKEKEYDITAIGNLKLQEWNFSEYDIEYLHLEPLLFQTGYVTIKEYSDADALYTLSYPNYEVKKSFLNHLLRIYSSIENRNIGNLIVNLKKNIQNTQVDQFLTILKSFFSGIPYDVQVKNEKYYQSVFYLIFTLLGFDIRVEQKTNKGRIDTVLETDSAIIIFEFKLYDTAENALKQIKDKEYHHMYLNTEKSIILIGVEFSFKERNITRWIVEKV